MLNKTKTIRIFYLVFIALIFSLAFILAFSFIYSDQIAYADEPETCTVTLYDDYGLYINDYTVISGSERIPSTDGRQRTGFNVLGWSESIDGEIISSDTHIVEDIELYLVYELKPPELTFDDFSTTYGNNEYPFILAQHEANDADISYKWYKISGENAALLEGETSNTLHMSNVVDCGDYKCEVTVGYGRYITTESKTSKITIEPYNIEWTNLSMFSKTYGEEDQTSIFYNVQNFDEVVGITFERQAGEDAGRYDLTGATTDNPNFVVTLIGESTEQFIIYKADLSYDFSFITQTFVYDGNEHILDYTADLPQGVSVDIFMIGDGVSAGEHTVTANFVIEDSHNYNSIPPVTSIMYIEKAHYDLSNTHFVSSSLPYDGMPHNIYMSGTLPQGLTVSCSQSDVVNAGEYSIIINFVVDQNHYPIDSIERTLTIYPKSIQPQFLLPEHPVENGELIEIEITSDGIIEGDIVRFNALSNRPLIEAGTYVITAECDNPNYALYNNTIVIQIYAANLSNSAQNNVEINIVAPEGINSDYTLYANQAELGIFVMGRFNKDKIKSAYEIRFFLDEIEVEPSAGFYINLLLTQEYINKPNLKVYFYNQELDVLQNLDYELAENTISFYSDSSGYFILVADPARLTPHTQANYEGLLKTILYIAFGVMLILIVVLIMLISRNKKRLSPATKPNVKTTYNIIRLNEKEREVFVKKLNNGEFVDWELNRDLPNYAIWKKMKIE